MPELLVLCDWHFNRLDELMHEKRKMDECVARTIACGGVVELKNSGLSNRTIQHGLNESLRVARLPCWWILNR